MTPRGDWSAVKQWLGRFGLEWKDSQIRAVIWALVAFVLAISLLSAVQLGQPDRPVGTRQSFDEGNETTSTGERITADGQTAASDIEEAERLLEAELQDILAQVAGAGKVWIDVTLSTSAQAEYAWQTTEERSTTSESDGQGGTRTVEQNQQSRQPAAIQASGSGQEALIVKTLRPEVAGVLVVAEGAGSARVKSDLSQAVATLLQVPIHRIYVTQGKGDAK